MCRRGIPCLPFSSVWSSTGQSANIRPRTSMQCADYCMFPGRGLDVGLLYVSCFFCQLPILGNPQQAGTVLATPSRQAQERRDIPRCPVACSKCLSLCHHMHSPARGMLLPCTGSLARTLHAAFTVVRSRRTAVVIVRSLHDSGMHAQEERIR